MSSCAVYLDDFRDLYFPGNVVTGKVVCVFCEAETIEGISIALTGSEYTNWTEWESQGHLHRKKRWNRPVHYHGNCKFLFKNSSLSGAGTIGPERREYLFTIELPKHLPSSYSCKYGWVKYMLKATVDRPNQTGYETEKELKIVSLVNFNEIQDNLQLEPVSYSQEKNLRGGWCCAGGGGPIVMDVHLQKAAFVVGETAKVNVEITNGSRKDIGMVVAEIGVAVTARVELPAPRAKQDYELLAISRQSGVEAHKSRNYSFDLEIPQTSGIPNFEQHLILFSQRSILKVTAVLSICHSLVLPMTVVIGSVAIGDDPAQHQQRILEQASFLAPPPLPPELSSTNLAGSEPSHHVVLHSRIPPPFPDAHVELYPPPLAPSAPTLRLLDDPYPPPIGISASSPAGAPGWRNVTSDRTGPSSSVGWESPPPSYEEATRPV